VSAPVQLAVPVDPEYYDARTALDGRVSFYGHHAKWCNNLDHDEPGVAVSDHGLECIHTVAALNEVASFSTGKGWLDVQLSAPYVHGTYDAEGPVRACLDAQWVKVSHSVDDEDDADPLFLTSGQARSLAAGLIRAADELELHGWRQ